MIVKKRLTSLFSWIHRLVIYQGYHEVSSLPLASAFRFPLAAASPKPSLVPSKDRVCCLIDLDSTIWEPFCSSSASLRFLSVFSASVSPRGRWMFLPNCVSLQIWKPEYVRPMEKLGETRRNPDKLVGDSRRSLIWIIFTFYSFKMTLGLFLNADRILHNGDQVKGSEPLHLTTT